MNLLHKINSIGPEETYAWHLFKTLYQVKRLSKNLIVNAHDDFNIFEHNRYAKSLHHLSSVIEYFHLPENRCYGVTYSNCLPCYSNTLVSWVMSGLYINDCTLLLKHISLGIVKSGKAAIYF